jgi:hypothetical protein
MEITISKIIALLLAVGYVIAAWLSPDGLPFAGTVALGALLPLGLIWFPEEIESWFRMYRKSGLLSSLQVRPSPAWLVVVMGWVLLVGIPLLVFLRR